MIDDRNKDPTFTYKVPDTVYKVPTPAEHAAEKVLHTRVLGGVLTGDSFADLLDDAKDMRQTFEAYAAQTQEPGYNQPSPLGNAEINEAPVKPNSARYGKFTHDFAATEERMARAGRSAGYPGDDAGLWVPLIEE